MVHLEALIGQEAKCFRGMGVYICDATDAESDEPERWMSPIDVRIDPVFAHKKGSGFQTVRPEEDFRRESLAAARRQNNLLLVEPYLSLESWESNGPRNALKAEVAGDKILALLDRMIRKSKKRSRDEQKRDRDANVHENERYVAGDRTAAFDAVMPLDGEILCTWHASLLTKTTQSGPPP